MTSLVANTLRDIRHAARSLWRTPEFSVVAFLTLALGIGATTIIFSLAYAIWLKPLPYADPEQLVAIRDVYRGDVGAYVSASGIEDIQRSPSIQDVGSYSYGAAIAKVDGDLVRIVSYQTSANLFPLLGVSPALGRSFLADDGRGSALAVILSDAFWRKQFHADPGVVGKSMEMFGRSYTIVGVMPQHFQLPRSPSDIWIPLIVGSESLEQRSLFALARLKLGATAGQMRAELATASAQRQFVAPATNTGWSFVATPLVDQTIGEYRPALGVLLGAVGVLLLIGCANIGSLFLARNTARRSELAVRVAFGATRWALTRQMLTEGLLLAMLGGTGGVTFAYLGTPLLSAMLPTDTPRLEEIGIDATVVVFALLISVVTGVLCALVPTARASLMIPGESLKGFSRAVAGGTTHRVQNGLVIVEVALSLMLITGAGLMLNSFFALLTRDRGFTTERLLTLDVVLPFARYRESDTRVQVYREIVKQLSSLPEVESVGAVMGFPGSTLGALGSGLVTADPANPGSAIASVVHASSPNYFRTMNVPLLAGRFFTEQDGPQSPNVLIINQSLASRLWPHETAVGKTLHPPKDAVGSDAPFTVVGVVGSMVDGGVASPELFVPTYQSHGIWTDLVIKTQVAPELLYGSVHRTLKGIEPDLLIENMIPMDRIISNGVALERTQSFIAGLFGLLAATLSVVGLYGLLSHLVSQRVREIGIRLALGASHGHVFGAVVMQGMMLTLVGVVIGGGGAYALARIMRKLVFGLSAADPFIFLGAALLLLTAAFVACCVPARRALRVDPISSLR